MIIGYIYSQKCNENAKKKRLIYFELWKLWKHSFVYILKKKVTRIRNVVTQFSLAFFLHLQFIVNIASDLNNKSSIQSVQSFQRLIIDGVVNSCLLVSTTSEKKVANSFTEGGHGTPMVMPRPHPRRSKQLSIRAFI